MQSCDVQDSTSLVGENKVVAELVADQLPSARSISTHVRRPRPSVSDESKLEIAHQVNTEKKTVKAVARNFSVSINTVYHIARLARDAARDSTKDAHLQEDGATVAAPRKRYGPLEPKTEAPMPASPFLTDDPIDLRGRKLRGDEKYYLACLVNIKRISAARVAKKYNLVGAAVGKFAFDVLTKEKPFQEKGRPRSRIDDESDMILRALAALDPRPSREDFKDSLAVEFAKTRERLLNKESNQDEAQTDFQHVGYDNRGTVNDVSNKCESANNDPNHAVTKTGSQHVGSDNCETVLTAPGKEAQPVRENESEFWGVGVHNSPAADHAVVVEPTKSQTTVGHFYVKPSVYSKFLAVYGY